MEISSFLEIAKGSSKAAGVINHVVKVWLTKCASNFITTRLPKIDGVKSSEVESAENEGNDTKANGMTQDHLLMSFVLSGDHGLSSLDREHSLHFVHFRSG